MIALNFAARYFALILIVFVIAATYTQHPFWSQSGPESTANMIHALKNLSLIGALFIIVGIGRGPRPVGGGAKLPRGVRLTPSAPLASWIARQTRSGVAGMSMWVMPYSDSASTTAFTIEGRRRSRPRRSP